MKGCEVNPTLLFDDDPSSGDGIEDDGITVKEDPDSGDGITVGAGSTRRPTAQSHSVGGSEKSLFREITESAIDVSPELHIRYRHHSFFTGAKVSSCICYNCGT